MFNIHIADDHPLFRQALVGVINLSFSDSPVSESTDLESTLEALDANDDIDLLLLDLTMPGSSGLLGLIKVREQFYDIPVVVISAREDDDTIKRCLAYGASGYIPKSATPKQIEQAVNTVLQGGQWAPQPIEHYRLTIGDNERDLAANIASLTGQQFKVLCYLKEGNLNKQIAYEMKVTEATIKAHITAIFKKLGLTNRTQVAIKLAHLDLDSAEAGSVNG